MSNQSRRSRFHQARYRQARGSSEGAGIWTAAALPIDAAIEALEAPWEALRRRSLSSLSRVAARRGGPTPTWCWRRGTVGRGEPRTSTASGGGSRSSRASPAASTTCASDAVVNRQFCRFCRLSRRSPLTARRRRNRCKRAAQRVLGLVGVVQGPRRQHLRPGPRTEVARAAHTRGRRPFAPEP